MTIRVYVAGPLHGSGLELQNIKNALYWGEQIWREKMIPFVPHLFSFWNYVYPKTGEQWLELDFAWLDACNALLRLPGESPGSDREVARMTALGRPVFSTSQFTELVSWARKEEARLEDLGIKENSPIYYDNHMWGKGEIKSEMLPKVCLDPEKMNGYCDQWGGSDFPCTD